MTTQSIVVYLAVYKTDADAEADYRAAKQQHAAGILKVFDAAVLHRDLSRDVHLVERGQRAPYGMCTGLAVGAFLGVILRYGVPRGARLVTVRVDRTRRSL